MSDPMEVIGLRQELQQSQIDFHKKEKEYEDAIKENKSLKEEIIRLRDAR